ncbi:MAG: AAA family ATPase [Acidobacteriia bacterium]|nr:AAA family ATPase [Terriglobia bacterium]
MTTITFYSYKGGVGRSLAVANVAKYLARFGQRVFAIDFDLEAPGLHYKFALDGANGIAQIKQGVVDYISAFRASGRTPDSLSDYVVRVEGPDKESSSGRIWLMPAGSVPSASYWRHLAQISWHDLFYSDSAPGVPLFLELKQQIEQQFKPDFLLIDARTGITEIGGVATTVLPEKLVCLLMKNRENLDGAREVLRSIKRVPKLPGQPDIEVVPVLTRIPEISEAGREQEVIAQVRDFLNEPAPDLSMTLNIDQVFVLHSEPGLELAEALRIGGEMSAAQSPLLRDYLRLFSRLVPREVIEPYVVPLVRDALGRSFDDPSAAEKDLQVLIDYSGHVEAYRGLLNLYRERRPGEALRTAEALWRAGGGVHDAVSWYVVQKWFPGMSKNYRVQRAGKLSIELDIVAEMWRSAGANDVEVGLELAEAFASGKDFKAAAGILQRLLENAGSVPQEALVVRYLQLLLQSSDLQAAVFAVEQYGHAFRESADFLREMARVIIQSGSKMALANFLDRGEFRVDLLKDRDPVVYSELLACAGRQSESEKS